MQFVTEPGCAVPVAGEYDVVVLEAVRPGSRRPPTLPGTVRAP
jgi:hypothetical protein